MLSKNKKLKWKEKSIELKFTNKSDGNEKQGETEQTDPQPEQINLTNYDQFNSQIEGSNGLIPVRKITSLIWTGPIMELKGYFYLEDIPMLGEDLVRKRLLLVNEEREEISIPLRDIPLDKLGPEAEKVDEKYYWAGFKCKVNFSDFENNKPISAGTYTAYLKLEVQKPGKGKVEKIVALGNIHSFLKQGFHATKMEYFSAKQEMKFNLLATYDQGVKTLKIKSTKLKDFDPRTMSLEAKESQGLFYRAFKKFGFSLLYNLFKLFPAGEKKVVFASDSRTELSGNLKFVYDEMVKRNLNLDYHFMLKSNLTEKKSYKELVELAYHLATAKFILLDDYYPIIYPLTIRKGSELVQLWHAVGAFKTFGYSRIGLPGGPSPKSKNHRNYTKAIVSSENVSKHYAEGFGIDEENVVATGIPRTDVFFDQEYQNHVKQELYEKFPFLKNKKVITFAPTFRGNGQQSAHYPMEVLDLDKLYHSLKDEYVFLFKIHPFVKNSWSIPYQYSDFFYDFSSYREINDLLFVTDILITDYSSVCFEFALLNKPMLFFAFDVEDYVQKRDFYYEYHSFIPGPLVKTTSDIIRTIERKNFELNKIKPFVHYFFDDLDGKSSERVIEHIILGIEEQK